ncbi:MAG: transporter [Flavobacteriia bacterium]|nr:transporter [Flavobacteriia bacterium]
MSWISERIRFDRNEFSGAFGDIGTDFPLILGMIAVSDADAGSICILYGIMQCITAFLYGVPMAVQPLKAVATIVIAGNIQGDMIYTAGFIIGFIMLFLSFSGLIKIIHKIIPLVVVRGIQIGLGLSLAQIAVTKYILPNIGNYLDIFLLIMCFVLALYFMGNRKYPPAFFIFGIGIIYSIFKDYALAFSVFNDVQLHLPIFQIPKIELILPATLLLALPQIPLSLGNSILASHQIVKDYFPEKKIGIQKISYTYSFMNLVSPFFGGIPVCHGSGGLVGHYNFGARTGGSLIIYGSFFILLGLFFSRGLEHFYDFMPLSVLGVILFFESLGLLALIKHLAHSKKELYVGLIIALISAGIPYGFLISMIVGTILHYSSSYFTFFKND